MRFDQPVGTQAERDDLHVWAGAWLDATGFAAHYNATGVWAYHTGADLNCNVPTWDADAHSPVYACADGLIVYASQNTSWGAGNAIIVIKHTLPERVLWSRYAHIENIVVHAGDAVTRGQQLAQIGNAGGRYPYHLHFDIAAIDLGVTPGDWPGNDLARLQRDYLDPLETIRKYHAPDGPVIPNGGTTVTDYIVQGDQHVHVRATPAQTAGNIVGKVATGKQVSGVLVNGWVKIPLTLAPPIEIDPDDGGLPVASGYMLASLLKAVGTTPPVVTPPAITKTVLGVSIIGNDNNAADYAISMGCKRIHVCFNDGLAIRLKQQYPDVRVSHRALFYNGHLPSLAEFREKHGNVLNTPGMIIFGVNENDQIGDGGQDGSQPNEIMDRAHWDEQMWHVCQDAGCIFVGGGFAMGTPNIVVPSIRDAMRRYYAPLFNAGMLLNQHMYTGDDHSGIPIKAHIFANNPFSVDWEGHVFTGRQTWFLEERPRFYVAACDFDGSKSAFESDETGVDGPGPFGDFNYSNEEKAAWAVEFIRKNSEPMPGGAPYRLNSATIFCSGDTGRWKAFEIRGAYPAFKQAGVWA